MRSHHPPKLRGRVKRPPDVSQLDGELWAKKVSEKQLHRINILPRNAQFYLALTHSWDVFQGIQVRRLDHKLDTQPIHAQPSLCKPD